jgi:hypothetical protein
MSRYRLAYAPRCPAACIATLAAALMLHVPPAQAGEVVTTDCLHGSGERYDSSYDSAYADRYGSDYGDSYGSRSSYTRPGSGHFRGGLIGRHRGGLVVGTDDQNGGRTVNGADIGSSNGYRDGNSNGHGAGSRTSYGSDSCVEIRHELTNPYVIQVPPPPAGPEQREAAEHERLWRARCHPAVKQDRYGVSRYVYAAPGCDYGKYE